jgi:threonine aldolase
MNFCSDNTSGAAPEILAALEHSSRGSAMAYGDDDLTRRVERRFRNLFEHDVAVFLVATGTAANALSLSVLVPPYGAVYVHPGSHLAVDECGAPEFFTGGARLVELAGPGGKLDPARVELELGRGARGVVHHSQPAALGLAQATESGTVYSPEEITALADLGRAHGLKVLMDGARFANAVASLGCPPADLTWRAGVDALSFGATKNGALAAEAVVLFSPEHAEEFGYRRKRAGHLFSKMRFLAAQFDAYLADGLWLRNATHSNRMATRLAEGLRGIAGLRILHPVQANEIFLALSERAIAGLESGGFRFYRWEAPEGERGPCIRLVTAFDTPVESVDAFIAAARRAASD